MLGPIYTVGFCEDMDPADRPEECDDHFTSQDVGNLDLGFSTPYGVTYEATSGNMSVTIQGGPTLNTTWAIQNNRVKFSSPTTVGNWMLSNLPANQVTPVTLDIKNVKIHAPGNSANQAVTITAKIRYNGSVVDSATTSYTYQAPPPQAVIRIERTGQTSCGWLITSMLSEPGYTFIIERKPVLGGSWSQTYSGVDTCIPRSGEYIYRGVYVDIFGNRGPVSSYKTTNCDPGPIP